MTFFHKRIINEKMYCISIIPYTIGWFDLDFFSKSCMAQADSVKIGQNGLPDPLIVILYLNGFS